MAKVLMELITTVEDDFVIDDNSQYTIGQMIDQMIADTYANPHSQGYVRDIHMTLDDDDIAHLKRELKQDKPVGTKKPANRAI